MAASSCPREATAHAADVALAMMWPTLKNRRQFDLVYSRGHKRTSQTLVVFLLDNAPDQRVAYVASRVVGGAVQRNRAKRLLRTAFRQAAAAGAMPQGWIVVVARRKILEHKSPFVTQELNAVLSDLDKRHLGDTPQPREPGAPRRRKEPS